MHGTPELDKWPAVWRATTARWIEKGLNTLRALILSTYDRCMDENRYGLITEAAGRGAVYEAHNPQAVYHDATNATYVGYRGPDADPYATKFNHDSRTFAEPTWIGENPLPDADNHGPPSICVTPDGHVLTFYGSHGRHHHVARTVEAGDITRWQDLGEMADVAGGTYPSPVFYEGDVYVMYRAGPNWYDRTYPSAQYGTIARTSDLGESFDDLGPVVDVTGYPEEMAIAYMMDLSATEEGLHMSWTICHDVAIPTTSPSQHRSGVYHAIFDPSAGVIRDLAGNRYEPPLRWEEMQGTPVEAFDAQDVNHPKHAHLGAEPGILFDHHNPASAHTVDDSSRVEWLVAFWNDRWELRRIPGALATHLFDGGYPRVNEAGAYEAYIVTGGSDPSLVDGRRGGDFEVATFRDDSFDRRTIVTADEVGPVSRVTTVHNARDEFSAIFQPASDSATDFDLPLYAYGTTWDSACK